MIAVIAGILIALFIGTLQQDYRDGKLLKSTLQSLSNEFSKNTANINQYLPRQARFLNTLRQSMGNDTLSIFDLTLQTQNGQGMGTADLYTTNWQAALNNNSLRFLNFQTVTLLSQIESKHQELKAQDMLFAPIVFGPPMFKRGKEGLEYRRSMELWLGSYMGNEKELLTLYQHFGKVVRTGQYRQK